MRTTGLSWAGLITKGFCVCRSCEWNRGHGRLNAEPDCSAEAASLLVSGVCKTRAEGSTARLPGTDLARLPGIDLSRALSASKLGIRSACPAGETLMLVPLKSIAIDGGSSDETKRQAE